MLSYLSGSWPAQLGTFEIWVGASAGDTTSASALKCGETTYRNPIGIDSEPYVVRCGGLSSGRFVTLRQVGPARYLVVAEIAVYERGTGVPGAGSGGGSGNVPTPPTIPTCACKWFANFNGANLAPFDTVCQKASGMCIPSVAGCGSDFSECLLPPSGSSRQRPSPHSASDEAIVAQTQPGPASASLDKQDEPKIDPDTTSTASAIPLAVSSPKRAASLSKLWHSVAITLLAPIRCYYLLSPRFIRQPCLPLACPPCLPAQALAAVLAVAGVVAIAAVALLQCRQRLGGGCVRVQLQQVKPPSQP